MAKLVTIDPDKLAAIKKSKAWKIALVILIVLGALLLTWVIIVQIKNYKQRQILAEAEKNSNLNTGSGGSGGGAPSSGSEWPITAKSSGGHVKALQHLVNQIRPSSKLVEDGTMGPLTVAALKAIDPKYFPVTAAGFTELAGLATTGKPSAPSGGSANQASDDLPLQEGSKGDKVAALKIAINKISPLAKLTQNNIFDHDTYKALVSYIGTTFYPVTLDKFIAIANMANTGPGSGNYIPPVGTTTSGFNGCGCDDCSNNFNGPGGPLSRILFPPLGPQEQKMNRDLCLGRGGKWTHHSNGLYTCDGGLNA